MIEVVVLYENQWIPLKIKEFSIAFTPESLRFKVDGVEEKWDEQSSER